jgi:hypothetical protein
MKKLGTNFRNFIISVFLAIFLGIGLVFFFMPIRNASIVILLPMILFLACIIMIVLSKNLHNWYVIFQGGSRYLFLTFTPLFTLCLLVSLKGEQVYLQDNNNLTILYVYISTYLTLLFIVLAIIRLMLTLSIKKSDKRVSKVRIILYALPSFIIFSLYLLGFFPGVMTFDSLFQWSQIHSNQYSDWHPVTHTWFLKLITEVWDYPAAIGIVQILTMSFVFGYGMYSFEKQGIKRWTIYLVTIAFAIMPLNGIYSVTIWKDILFSTSIMFMTILLFNIVITNGEWLHKLSSLFLFFFASAGIVFFRHNGFIAFVVTMVVFFFIYRLKLTRMYVVALIIIALHFIITGPIYKHFNVIPSDPNEAYSVPIQQIGRIIAYDGKLTKQQLNYYNQVLPIEEWKSKYDPYFADTLKGNPKYNRPFLYAHKAEFFKYWLELCQQNPKLAISAYTDFSSLIWRIYTPKGYFYMFSSEPPTPFIFQEYNIKQMYGNQQVKRVLSGVLSRSSGWFKPLYRPAAYLFLTVLLLFVIVLKGNWKITLISFPVLLNMGTIAAALPTQDVRYLYANFLVIFIIFLATIAAASQKKKV